MVQINVRLLCKPPLHDVDSTTSIVNSNVVSYQILHSQLMTIVEQSVIRSESLLERKRRPFEGARWAQRLQRDAAKVEADA
jgi:hypothetical protein